MPESIAEKPIRVEAQRMTPEEDAAARQSPVRTVRARRAGPPPTRDVTRARWRGVIIGAALAGAAAVAAAAGHFWWGRRSPQKDGHA